PVRLSRGRDLPCRLGGVHASRMHRPRRSAVATGDPRRRGSSTQAHASLLVPVPRLALHRRWHQRGRTGAPPAGRVPASQRRRSRPAGCRSGRAGQPQLPLDDRVREMHVSNDKPDPMATAEAPGVHTRRLWSFRPQSDRQAGDAVVANFILHWFPAKALKDSLSWRYSMWLGTVSPALLALLVLSGLPLMFLHVPSVERAYASVKDIEYVVTFGSWLRSVHRLSAHLMVAFVFLHLVRVFLTGA